MVRHFFAYIHSPQVPNWVRVPLTWNFNQVFNHLYTWISAPIDSYTISSSLNSLEGFITQKKKKIKSLNLAQQWNTTQGYDES